MRHEEVEMMKRGCARVVRVAGGLVVCLTMSACEPPPEVLSYNELQFWGWTRPGIVPVPELIVEKRTDPGDSYAWGPNELGTLPNEPLNNVFMRYHMDGDPLDVRGGFFMDFFLRVGLSMVPAMEIDYNTNHRFVLQDGILGLIPDINYYRVYGYEGAVEQFRDAMHGAVKEQLPALFWQEALKRQTTQLLGDDPDYPEPEERCSVGSTGQCWLMDIGLTTAIERAAASGAVDLTPEEAGELQETVSAKDDNLNFRHWTCVPTPRQDDEEDAGTCLFVLRAKRLNVYPHDVELVWFDGKELDNPTYGLWVATFEDVEGGVVARSELCQITAVALEPDGPYYRRWFSAYNAPWAGVQF